MSHDHASVHSHALERPPGRAFAIGISVNLLFVLIEATAGVLAGSVALVADAAHNLSDVLGLFLAWGAVVLARRRPSRRRTYGLRKTTILAALANGILLLVAVGGVSWEAIGRFRSPQPADGEVMIIVAGIGVLINTATALLFARGRERDVNLRGAFQHLAADAAVSLGVVVAGLILSRTGWRWLDPSVSLLISAVVLVGTWGLLREALDLMLDAVPAHINPAEVRAYLAGLPGVTAVHDLHIWAMSSTEAALTAHLIMPAGACPARFLDQVAEELHERFHIDHSTVQIEVPRTCEDPPCRQVAEEHP